MSNQTIQSQSVSMSDAMRGVWRRKLLIASTLTLGVLAGAAVLALVKPSYQSEAQVIIENLATPYEKINGTVDTTTETVSDRLVASQVAVLKSQDLAARISNALKLKDLKEFNAQLRTHSIFSQMLVATGFKDDPALLTPEQLTIKHVLEHVTVYPVPESNVVGIKYSSEDGKIAADVANAMAESYVLSTRENQSGSTGRAREWLSQQITDLREKVSTSEAEVEKYRSEAGLLKGGSTSTLNEQQISELNTQITLAEAASSEATARANEIRSLLASKGSVDASSDVLASPVIQSLRQQQSNAGRKLSELSATYLPNHPKMIAASKELQALDNQVRREALKVVDSLAGQSKVAAARADSLRSSLEKMKARQSTENLDDVKLKELERNALANRTLLEAMLARFADANARQDLSLQPGYARVIQKASVQSVPYFPKPGPIMLLTSLVGLGLGLGLAFLFEVIQSAARIGQQPSVPFREVQEQLAPQNDRPSPSLRPAAMTPSRTMVAPAPVAAVEPQPSLLAQVPTVESLSQALKLIEPSSVKAQSDLAVASERLYQSLKPAIENKSLKSLAFITLGGQVYDAGLSSVAAARTFAAHKLKVVLVDVSAGNSEALVGLPQGSGLSDLILGEADFTKVICRDPASAAHVIRFGLKNFEVSRDAIAEKFSSIMAALNTIYDVVVVNAGEATQSTPALAQYCTAAVFIAAPDRQKDAIAASKFLEQGGVHSSIFMELHETDVKLARSA
jgi:polysaccharide biosynthesis transport protein